MQDAPTPSRAELADELALANVFLDAIIEGLPAMIFVKDATDLKFVRFNRAGEDLLGYAREDLYGKCDYDFFPADEADFFTMKDREVLTNGQVVDIPQEPIQTAKGLRWLHTRKVPVFDQQGNPRFLLGVSMDITQRIEIEAERQRLANELARSNEELEHFASMASHDLQEPLRTISAFAELLTTRLDPVLDDETRRWLAFMTDACSRMNQMVTGILDIARLGSQPRKAVEVPLSEVLATVTTDLRLAIQESAGVITGGESLPNVKCDPTQIAQVFTNLISNALRYSRDGHPPQVHLSTTAKHPGMVSISVTDNGCGIPQARIESMFDVFRRNDERAGSGIGLAIVRRVLEAHGGSVNIESTVGVGTTVWVHLPA